ncbi:recombinase family protein [Maribacter aquivivus]|uniref:recombinase family protein n=1 Tax=Maribacter aquivivus TaxID=228958 RepID=UPI002494D9CB|nr:recombinase family protein [Maribacter aquivivus]
MLAIYCRISVDRENQKSIKEQELLGKEFAKTNSLDFEIYVDKGISGGGDISKRPAFEKMIGDIHDKKVKAVYVWNQDRTEREEVTWFTLANLIIENDIQLYENGTLIDLNDPTIYFMRGMLSQMNALYRRTTSKKIKAVLSRNASEGKAHSSILPYGYGKDDKGYLIIDLDEAKIVEEIYELSLKGIGTRSIAEKLNNDDVKTRYNKIAKGTISTVNKYTGKVTKTNKSDVKWSGNTIRNIIKNTLYKGVRKFGGKTYNAPALFDELYWNKVNENLKNNANNSGKKVEHKYLLKGLLICGNCGRNYYGRTRVNKKDNYYMCSSKRYKTENCGNRGLNIGVLEDFIWLKLIVTKNMEKLINDYLKDNSNEGKKTHLKNDLASFSRAQDSLSKERDNAVKLAIKGLLKESDIQSEIERIDREILDINTKIRNTSEQMESYNEVEKKLSEIGIDLYQIKETTSFNDKRDIINKYIKSITISYKDNWYYLDIEFNIIDMPIESFKIDNKYNIAIQISESIEGLVIQLKSGDVYISK